MNLMADGMKIPIKHPDDANNLISSKDLAEKMGAMERSMIKVLSRTKILDFNKYNYSMESHGGRTKVTYYLDDLAVGVYVFSRLDAPTHLKKYLLEFGCNGIIEYIRSYENPIFYTKRRGCFYCISDGEITKVGISVEPESRVNSIKRAAGMDLKLSLISNATEDYREIEKIVLKQFEPHRINGSEWLNIKPYSVLNFVLPHIGVDSIEDMMDIIAPNNESSRCYREYFDLLGFPQDLAEDYISAMQEIGVIEERL
jgi:hypothetical protein